MPWHAAKSAACPAAKPWAVIKDTDGTVVACHPSKAAAQKQVAALYANEQGASQMSGTAPNGQAIIRASNPGVKLRAHPDGGMPTLYGHFAVFNKWTEIDSWM